MTDDPIDFLPGTQRTKTQRVRDLFDQKLAAISDDVRTGLQAELRQHGPTLRFNETLWMVYRNRAGLMGYDVTASALNVPAAFVESCRVALMLPEI